MEDNLKKAFDHIHASSSLKEKTKIYIKEKTLIYPKKHLLPFKSMAFAAALCIFLFIGGYWVYFIPTASISIDINPSVELEINRLNKVISVKGYNEDGRELAKALDIHFMDYTDAICNIIENTTITSLLSDNEVMAITVVCENDKQNSSMMSRIKEYTNGNNNMYCYCADPDDVADAHNCGLSYGKYRAYLELQAVDPDISPEEIQNMTMCQIHERIRSLSEDSDSTDNAGENGHQHRNGHNHH